VLARASAPDGNGAISVNTGYYRRPGDGMPPVVTLTGDDGGMLIALNGKQSNPDVTVDQMAGYLAEYYGYALAGRDERSITLTRGVTREVSNAEAG
jgi:hypothetical protein